MTQERKATDVARRSIASLAIMGAVAGLLIWSKLRVTTTVPRAAYAVPQEVEPENNREKATRSNARDVQRSSHADAPDRAGR